MKSNVRPFIPKENPDLPDSYSITVFYLDGKSDVFEVASHKILKDLGCLEIISKEDEWSLVPLTSVKRFAFDKQFSRIIAINQEMREQAAKAKAEKKDDKVS